MINSICSVDSCVSRFKFMVKGCEILVIPQGINFVEVIGLGYFLETIARKGGECAHIPQEARFYIEVVRGELHQSNSFINGVIYAAYNNGTSSEYLSTFKDSLAGYLRDFSWEVAQSFVTAIAAMHVTD